MTLTEVFIPKTEQVDQDPVPITVKSHLYLTEDTLLYSRNQAYLWKCYKSETHTGGQK